MALITVNKGESIESALRRFKRRVIHEGIIQDAKKHAYFIPPGKRAKLKSKLARKRRRKTRRAWANPVRERTEPMKASATAK